MHHFDPILYEPEFNNFDSYYLTWHDSSYSSNGPYGEPLEYSQEEMSNESNSVYEGAGDGFLSGSWFPENRLTDQVYDTLELPYNGGSNWVDEYEYYFASCWGEDRDPPGYGYTGYEDYNGSIEKAEVTHEGGDQEGTFYSYNNGLDDAQSDTSWPGCHVEFVNGVEDIYSVSCKQEQQPANNNNDPSDYHMGLWESIFGYWPCLQRLDEDVRPTYY